MISLKTKGLPNAIEVNGQLFFIKTDFRVWITFHERMRQYMQGDTDGYKELFDGPAPWASEAVIKVLCAFYDTPCELPRTTKSGGRVIDFDLDADRIFAAFLQAYGIDLTTEDLHWHKFSALLAALPDDTLMCKVIGWRSYDGKEKDILKLKQAWALPLTISEEEREAMEEFNSLFG
ncbi:bacteriophage Gp15 family protein [Clostridiales Family XIII bacterium ASD5510]|uniref:Bacteriophage Gp15 family protein n=1 Tax=Hominibacterium faecale TaxID=2839743 RepID=A0A9J6QZ97_9FIRM|nr:Gp15 family bacteriophage protein [Hominibacterium faecale]MCU7380854.1 bacteriophage Gp15 family protein [Hominibacterium faecale]